MSFQADSALDRARGGLGIGLSVAKRLVKLHAGRIEGHSDGLGRGAEFIVHLPTMKDSEGQNGPSSQSIPEGAPNSATHRVLLVDDSVDTIETVAAVAKSLGHEVAVARDGRPRLNSSANFCPRSH
jgi:hypoxanthine phosphoribosyltransferase